MEYKAYSTYRGEFALGAIIMGGDDGAHMPLGIVARVGGSSISGPDAHPVILTPDYKLRLITDVCAEQGLNTVAIATPEEGKSKELAQGLGDLIRRIQDQSAGSPPHLSPSGINLTAVFETLQGSISKDRIMLVRMTCPEHPGVREPCKRKH